MKCPLCEAGTLDATGTAGRWGCTACGAILLAGPGKRTVHVPAPPAWPTLDPPQGSPAPTPGRPK